MSYTPVTQFQVPELIQFQWSTPDDPTPRLSQPISATQTTLYFTSAPLDHAGAVITLATLIGVKNQSGYVETVYIPNGGVSADGLTATGCVRGIRLEGLDCTTGDSSLAVAANQDSPVFCNVSAVIQAINAEALTAGIGANIKFNGRMLFMGSGVNACPVFANATARDAAIVAPQNGDQCYNTADGVFQDYTGGSWLDRDSGTVTPNASETVAGKIELATVAEQGAATSTGGTGARLVMANSNLVKTSSGASDENKIAVLDATGKYAQGFLPTAYLVPTGSVQMFAGSSAPSEWLLCDGSAVSRTTYAALFAVLGTTFGVGNGSTTFNVPDMRGRAPIGAGTGTGGGAAGTGLPTGGSALTARALAAWTGAETHVLTTAEMPAHTHLINQMNTDTSSTPYSSVGGGGGSGSDTKNTGSTGSGTAHTIVQPVMTLNFIIKI